MPWSGWRHSTMACSTSGRRLSQIGPISAPPAGGPLVGAVQDLAEDVVLVLVAGFVCPAHRGRGPVALQLRVDPLLGRDPAVQVVQHRRPGPALDQGEHPGQEGPGLRGKADAPQGVYREGGVADPGVALRGGEQLAEHHAPGAVTLQVVRGRVRLSTDGERWELGRGRPHPDPAHPPPAGEPGGRRRPVDRGHHGSMITPASSPWSCSAPSAWRSPPAPPSVPPAKAGSASPWPPTPTPSSKAPAAWPGSP
jgi:hypothetical protein